MLFVIRGAGHSDNFFIQQAGDCFGILSALDELVKNEDEPFASREDRYAANRHKPEEIRHEAAAGSDAPGSARPGALLTRSARYWCERGRLRDELLNRRDLLDAPPSPDRHRELGARRQHRLDPRLARRQAAVLDITFVPVLPCGRLRRAPVRALATVNIPIGRLK